MPPELATTPSTSIPIELQAALDLVALLAGCQSGRLSGRVVGDPLLVDALERYAPVDAGAGRLIALAAEPAGLTDAVLSDRPAEVVALAAGSLAAPLRPLRAEPVRLPNHLPASAWDSLGYRRVASRGVQGPASIAWALAERLLARRGRPDLADRCRIAMLRTLCAAGPSRALGTVAVRSYRRAA